MKHCGSFVVEFCGRFCGFQGRNFGLISRGRWRQERRSNGFVNGKSGQQQIQAPRHPACAISASRLPFLAVAVQLVNSDTCRGSSELARTSCQKSGVVRGILPVTIAFSSLFNDDQRKGIQSWIYSASSAPLQRTNRYCAIINAVMLRHRHQGITPT
jgi:hypothetical protein